MEVSLCKVFPAFSPISLRKEKAVEVFKLIDRYTKYINSADSRKKRSNMKHAGNNWF